MTESNAAVYSGMATTFLYTTNPNEHLPSNGRATVEQPPPSTLRAAIEQPSSTVEQLSSNRRPLLGKCSLGLVVYKEKIDANT